MAVSYLSTTPFKASPYVAPINLDLMARVNTYKQENFYKNAESIKNKYSQLLNSDIINDEQKQYLKNKYNNLTSQIQEWGSLDFSDMNIANQISGYAQDIYNDPTIIKGISSTKQIRKLQSDYEKLKSDPKLNKYYAPQNEWWDTRKVQDYVSGGINASYSGPSSPTTYIGNPFQLVTAKLKEIRPDITSGMTDANDLYFKDVNNKVLDPNKIYAMLEGQIDPAILNQIKINSAYSMQGMTAEDVEKSLQDRHNKQLLKIDANIKKFESDLLTETDTERQKQIQKIIDDNKLDYAETTKKFDVASIREQTKTEDGLISLKTQIGLQNLFDSAVTAYSYKEIKETLKLNQAKIFQQKLEREDTKIALAQRKMLNDETYRNNMLALKQQELLMKAKEGDDNNNKSTLTGDTGDNLSKGEIKDNILSVNKINDLIYQSEEAAAVAIQAGFIDAVGEKWPGLTENIAKIDKKPGIHTNEILEATGWTDTKTGEVHLGKVAMSPEAKQWALNVYAQLQRATQGDDKALSTANFNLRNGERMLNTIRTANIERNYYNDLKNKAKDYAINEYAVQNKVSVDEAGKLYDSNINVNMRQVEIIDPQTGATSYTWEKRNPVKEKFNKYENNYFMKNSSRNLYTTVYLNPNQFKKLGDEMQGLLKKEAGYPNADASSFKPLELLRLDDASDRVKTEKKRYKIRFEYKDNDSKESKTGDAFITAEQAERFDVYDDPNYKQDYVLKKQGYLDPFPITVNLKNQKFAFMAKPLYNPYNGEVSVNLTYGKDQINIKYNGKDNSGLINAGYAEKYIRNMLKEAEKTAASKDELISVLKQLGQTDL